MNPLTNPNIFPKKSGRNTSDNDIFRHSGLRFVCFITIAFSLDVTAYSHIAFK